MDLESVQHGRAIGDKYTTRIPADDAYGGVRPEKGSSRDYIHGQGGFKAMAN